MSPKRFESINNEFLQRLCLRYMILRFGGFFLSVFKKKKAEFSHDFFKLNSIFLGIFPSLSAGFSCINVQWITNEACSTRGTMEVSVVSVWCLCCGVLCDEILNFSVLDFFEVQILSFLDSRDPNRHGLI